MEIIHDIFKKEDSTLPYLRYNRDVITQFYYQCGIIGL